MLIHSRLEIQTAEPSGFFFSFYRYPTETLKVAFLSEIPVTAAKFTGVVPSGWPSWARVSEQGLAAQ